jgi:hypothetical protein
MKKYSIILVVILCSCNSIRINGVRIQTLHSKGYAFTERRILMKNSISPFDKNEIPSQCLSITKQDSVTDSLQSIQPLIEYNPVSASLFTKGSETGIHTTSAPGSELKIKPISAEPVDSAAIHTKAMKRMRTAAWVTFAYYLFALLVSIGIIIGFINLGIGIAYLLLYLAYVLLFVAILLLAGTLIANIIAWTYIIDHWNEFKHDYDFNVLFVILIVATLALVLPILLQFF